MTPLTAFLLLFDVKMGPKSTKNHRKIGPRNRKFFDPLFTSILARVGAHLGAILRSKKEQKSNKSVLERPSKNERKKITKNTQNSLGEKIRQVPPRPNRARPYVFKAKALLIKIKRSTTFVPKGHFTALPVIRQAPPRPTRARFPPDNPPSS